MATKPGDLPSLYASPPVAAALAGSSTPAGGLLTGGYPGPSRIPAPAPSVTPGTVPSAPAAPGPVDSSIYGPSLYAAAAAAAQAYLPFATASETSSFYPHHMNGGDGATVDAWRNFSAAHAHHSAAAAAAAWAYDPAGAVIGYPYGPGYGGLDVRRKNATRESTSTLKAWLYEHIKNPYPTKGEKIMLAIITRMTLTQVSTWFANARRRLKKENKMQWSPRNRTGDDDDDDDDNKNNASDLDDDLDGRRTPRSLCDDSNDIDVGVDIGNDDAVSVGDLAHDIRMPGERPDISGLHSCADDVNGCTPHCGLLQRRLHIANGLLPDPAAPHHHLAAAAGLFWNSAAAAAAAASGSPNNNNNNEDLLRRIQQVIAAGASRQLPSDYISQHRLNMAAARADIQTSSAECFRSDIERRSVPSAVKTSSANDNSKPSTTEKPRIWSIADVATSGTPNGRRSVSPSERGASSSSAAEVTNQRASDSPTSPLASVIKGFQPWAEAAAAAAAGVDPTSRFNPHHPLFRVYIPPPSGAQSLPSGSDSTHHHGLHGANGLLPRFGPYSVSNAAAAAAAAAAVAAAAGAGSSAGVAPGLPPPPHASMASHPASLAHQLAAAAAHAAAVSAAAVQARLQQQQHRMRYSPIDRHDAAELETRIPSSLRVPTSGSTSSTSAAAGVRSPRAHGESGTRWAAAQSTSSRNGRTADRQTPDSGDSCDGDRTTPSSRKADIIITSSRDASPPVGATAAVCLAPTAFKPFPTRRL